MGRTLDAWPFLLIDGSLWHLSPEDDQLVFLDPFGRLAATGRPSAACLPPFLWPCRGTEKRAVLEPPDLASSDAVCLVAAAPSITPWSLRRERTALRGGGVDAVFATVASLEDTGQAVTRVGQWLSVHEDPDVPARVATSVAEIHAAKSAGNTAVVLHFQGSEPLRGETGLVGMFARLGVRVIQPTYNYRSLAGDGCCEPENAGLSVFGRALIGAMNEHRVAVDVAHGGVRTSMDAIGCSARPVIASHANARGVCDHPRNLADEVIKAVATSGGVIGLCAFSSFVTAEPGATLDQLLDHAVYIADLVGAGHVGLGLDFADEGEEEYDFYGYDERYYPRPPWTWPRGIEWLDQCASIGPALRQRGFSPAETAGILGSNFLRVLTTIWGS
jgi:membrane dipeptidase